MTAAIARIIAEEWRVQRSLCMAGSERWLLCDDHCDVWSRVAEKLEKEVVK